jgi:superfamily II DNA or RNA helicase
MKSRGKNPIIDCSDWASFQKAVSSLPNLEKGHAFEDFVFLSLQIQPRDTTKYKQVWKIRRTNRIQDSVPVNVRQKLNLPEPDLGIDLLAETFDGEYHAIQCKYHSDTEDSVALKEVTQGVSLAFSHCKGISHFILATSGGSGGKRSRHLKGYAEGKLSIRDIGEWRRLDKSFFDNARKVLASRKPLKPVAYKPRKHQSRAIKNALQHFVKEKHDRGKMIMPCGSGKSLTGFWIAQQMGAKKIVVAVPSLALVKQTLEVWAEQSVANRISVSWICVCSDKSVGQSEDEDSVQLQDLGVKVHTDPSDIAKWLRKRFEGLKVVFTTYQSGEALSNAATIARCRFDFGVFDEAHKTVGNKDKAFAHLLFDENIRIKRRMFMTATERRYIGSGESILSMHDPEVYGETFDLLSFKEALECEPPILSDYKIVTIEVGEEELKRELAKNILVKPDKGRWVEAQEIRTLAAALAIRKATKKFGVKHIISFHSSVARAQAFQKTHDRITDAVPEYGKLDTYHVSSQQNTGQRQDIIGAFANAKKSLITNARCLTEGVDIKQVDCVVFADPKRSTVDIVQAAGRALRPCEGKKRGYIVIPIPVSGKTVEKRIEESEEFRDVMMTLRSLASNDKRIIEYFKAVSEGKKFSKGDKMFEHFSVAAGTLDLSSFQSQIELVAWNKLAKLSWRPFEEARAFVRALKLRNQKEWIISCRSKVLPVDIPASAPRVYADKGWKSWGDWLGTGTLANRNRSFKDYGDAQLYSTSLGLLSKSDWRDFAKTGGLPEDIPANPSLYYKNRGWKGWGEWLGTKTVAPQNRQYRVFDKARHFVRKLKLKSVSEWRGYIKQGNLPDDIPSAPDRVYKTLGWRGFGDWLGNGQTRDYLPFNEARDFVRSLSLKRQKDWIEYTKSADFPDYLPANPASVFKNLGWINIGDWLGTKRVGTKARNYLSFKAARRFARQLKLKSQIEWRRYAKSGRLPNNMPACPDRIYKNKGWIGYGDWLGTGFLATRVRKFRAFSLARKFARSLQLNSSKDWRVFAVSHERPDDIPSNPEKIYKDKGWVGYADWLGTSNISNRKRVFLSFEEARAYAHSLKLKTLTEWNELSKNGQLPSNVPKAPSLTYKNKGWKGAGDWLGTGSVSNAKKVFRPFSEARAFARTLKLLSISQWRAYSKSDKRPNDIPTAPWRTYSQEGWINIGDWLGTGNVATSNRKYRSFRSARKFVRSLGLKNISEWREYTKSGSLPADIPACPNRTYANKGWQGVPDWLGTKKKT